MREKKRVRTASAAARAAVLCLFMAAGAWALASMGTGCLPELTPIAPTDAGEEGSVALPLSSCGDGIIATLDDGGDAGESCDPGDAAVLGCRSCRIDCESGGTLDPATGHCYFPLPERYAQYVQARNACRAANAHLVTFGTTAEVEIATALAKGQPYWVGLIFDNQVPGFSSASPSEPGFPRESSSGPCDGCFGVGTDAGVIPPEGDAGGDCVVARGASTWLTHECIASQEPLTAICEREPDGYRTTSCIGGFCFNVLRTAGRKTYLLGVDTLTASEANATCKSLDDRGEAGPGTGRLAVLETVEEREQIAREIALRYPTDQETTYWIGLANAGTSWQWDDGEPATDASTRRSPWGDKQPSLLDAGATARAYMRIASIYDVSLAYAEADSTARRRYICERAPR